VILRQPVLHGRGQKVGSVSIHADEAAHRKKPMNALPPLSRITSASENLESPTDS
jgi:hypothetical protein